MENKILGVRFKKTGKLQYMNPLKFGFRLGDMIIASTENGEEMARVVKIIEKEELPASAEVKDIIKPATRRDLELQKANEEEAKKAFSFCKKEAEKLKLNMKLLTAEYTFDRSKLMIYFTSEERVDFRDLVRIMASEYRTRIELRQIGARDEVKCHKNLGICGKETCCRTFLQELESVTIKSAKEQGLQINMQKLSGACEKLKCCLKYEEETYREHAKKLPKNGTIVKLNNETGVVVGTDILSLKVNVRFGKKDEDERYETHHVDELKFDKKEVNEVKKEEIK